MGQLDLKKLAKGMNVIDKMKLLFEDTNLKTENGDEKALLTPQERDAIIEDARKNGEIGEIRRVNELYIFSNYIAIDINSCLLCLYLSICQLEKTLTGIILKGATNEIVSSILFDFAKNDKTANENDFDKRIAELRNKYKVDSVLFKGFDFFTQTTNESGSNDEPNIQIQQIFMLAFRNAKILKKRLFNMECVLKKSPIDFLAKSNKNLVAESEELLAIFANLDSSLKPLRIYRDYMEDFIGDSKMANPEFAGIIKDIGNALSLSEQEKIEQQSAIDKHLKENL